MAHEAERPEPSGGPVARCELATHPSAQQVRLGLLGGFTLSFRGEELKPSLGARRLLALLAVEPRGLTRARAAEVLWPDLERNRAAAALRTALHRMPACPVPLVKECGAGLLTLSPDVAVDLAAANRAAARILGPAVEMDDRELGRALDLDFGYDLLPDWAEEWLTHGQIRWHQRRLHALETLSRRLAEAGFAGAAVDVALVAIGSDRLRESAHEALVAAYRAAGNEITADAYRRQYERQLREELARESVPRGRPPVPAPPAAPAARPAAGPRPPAGVIPISAAQTANGRRRPVTPSLAGGHRDHGSALS
ncbi:AfsR/SARP family transcriptional regulator [Kitasatospora sp. NPDC004272]